MEAESAVGVVAEVEAEAEAPVVGIDSGGSRWARYVDTEDDRCDWSRLALRTHNTPNRLL